MFVQEYIKKKGDKVYRSVFVSQSYREAGKVRHRHLANISALPDSLIDAIRLELKGMGNFKAHGIVPHKQGKACGAMLVIKEIAKRQGILQALGNDRQGLLALLQITGRILVQRSRLYLATQWQEQQAVEEVLGMGSFTEDDLYANLDWLSEHQEEIEEKIFKFRSKGKNLRSVYLYDVTSSYLEGTQNQLAAFGYNRDGKKGKMQIVIGLLCDEEGYPVSIEVFEGNTSDVSTVTNQLKKLKGRFGIENVVFVGDRGMVKSASIEDIDELKWFYITAITKPQIETMIKKGAFQMDLFTKELVEVKDGQTRYVLHCNPVRVEEISQSRQQKISKIAALVEKKNKYLAEHPRARESAALDAVGKKASQLKVTSFLKVSARDRVLSFEVDQEGLAEAARLDGCYAIKSNVTEEMASAKTIHERYKDLAMVEQAFRTMKQAHEEIRPIFVRKKMRTRGHVFICMLAYLIVKNVWDTCKELDIEQVAIFQWLDRIQYIQYDFPNITLKPLPGEYLDQQTRILSKLKIKMPMHL